jgi:plastocyanin
MRNPLPIKVFSVLVTTLALALCLFGVAQAAEIGHCDAYPDATTSDCRFGPTSPTNWSGTMTLPQFNPALGTLTAVQLTVEGYVQGDVRYENTGPNPAVISATHSVTISLQLPNNQTIYDIPTTTKTETVPEFDGVADFGGPSGRTFTITATRVVSQLLVAPAEIAPFLGTGNVTINATATGISFINGPGNLNALLQAQAASVVLAIVYYYDTPGIDIVKLTNGRDANDPNGGDVPQIAPGAPVVWTYLVRNTGLVPYTQAEVIITDDQPGVTPQLDLSSDNGDGLLSPGETWRYTATLPAQDLLQSTGGVTIVDGCDPGGTGFTRPTYRNIGTVQVRDLSATDPSHYCNPPVPGIDIKKFTNGRDADGPNDPDVPQIAPGATVTWTYRVTNTGQISYTRDSVVVTDNQPGVTPVLVDDSDGDNFLAPGEVWIYRATAPAQNLLRATAGTTVVPGCAPNSSSQTRTTYQNVGTVVVGELTDFDPSHYCNPPTPGIAIKKLTNGNDANDPNGRDVPAIQPGDTVTWTYLVTNTGNIAFTQAQIIVTDDQAGVIPVLVPTSDNGDRVLSPGETWRYQATGTAVNLSAINLTVNTVDGCAPNSTDTPQKAYVNIGTVIVTVLNSTISDSDPSHYCNVDVPTRLDEEAEPELQTPTLYLPFLRPR